MPEDSCAAGDSVSYTRSVLVSVRSGGRHSHQTWRAVHWPPEERVAAWAVRRSWGYSSFLAAPPGGGRGTWNELTQRQPPQALREKKFVPVTLIPARNELFEVPVPSRAWVPEARWEA